MKEHEKIVLNKIRCTHADCFREGMTFDEFSDDLKLYLFCFLPLSQIGELQLPEPRIYRG